LANAFAVSQIVCGIWAIRACFCSAFDGARVSGAVSFGPAIVGRMGVDEDGCVDGLAPVAVGLAAADCASRSFA